MKNVADTLASLLYKQLREEMQLLAKKAHIAIPNHIRLVQDTLTQSSMDKPLDEGEQWIKVEEALRLDGLTIWIERNAKMAKETLL